MESNRDEAIKCLSIARRHRDSGNFPSARRFCQKSISLYSTPEAQKLLQIIDDLAAAASASAAQEPSSSSTPYTSGSETHSSASGSKHRHTSASSSSASTSQTSQGTASGSGGEKRDYTPEQAAIVKRIRSCKATEYYEILSVKKDCEEVEIKRAYRKLALQLHPDKNGSPDADEAFKMVSKAFQILSDPQKRAIYDEHGSDPDSRFSGMPSSARDDMAGFNGGPFAGRTFDGELSPEDLFNMFFGGGGGGVPFAAGPGVFTTSFGPGGFRTTRVHMGGRRPGAGQQGRDTSIRTIITQLLPLLLLFVITLITALPNLLATSGPPDPRYSFTKSSRYNTERSTAGLNVRYHVNAAEFSAHPIGVDLAQAQSSNKRSPLLASFERNVERTYTTQLYNICQRETDRKQRRIEQNSGFLGIGADWEAIKKIEGEKIESCEELRRMGLIA